MPVDLIPIPPSFWKRIAPEPLSGRIEVALDREPRPETPRWGPPQRVPPRTETYVYSSPKGSIDENGRRIFAPGGLFVRGPGGRLEIETLDYNLDRKRVIWSSARARTRSAEYRLGQLVGGEEKSRLGESEIDLWAGPIVLAKMRVGEIEAEKSGKATAKSVAFYLLNLRLLGVRKIDFRIPEDRLKPMDDAEYLLTGRSVPVTPVTFGASPRLGFAVGANLSKGEYPVLGSYVAYTLTGAEYGAPTLMRYGQTAFSYGGDYYANVGVRHPRDLFNYLSSERRAIGAILDINTPVEGDAITTMPGLAFDATGRLFGKPSRWHFRLERKRSRDEGTHVRGLAMLEHGLWQRSIGKGALADLRLEGVSMTDGYSWGRAALGASILATRHLRMGAATYLTGALGSPTFASQRVDEGVGTALRADAYLGPTNFAYTQRYSARRGFTNAELGLRQVAGPFNLYLRYNLETRGIGFGFDIRRAAFTGAFEGRRIRKVTRDEEKSP